MNKVRCSIRLENEQELPEEIDNDQFFSRVPNVGEKFIVIGTAGMTFLVRDVTHFSVDGASGDHGSQGWAADLVCLRIK